MNRKAELFCAYSGFIFVILLGAGMWCMTSWFRPVDPSLTPSQIQLLFIQQTTRIRIGASLLAFGAVFFWPLSAAITNQMKRMEGGSHPLATVQLATSSGTVISILFIAFIWLTVAFRPETYAPQTMQFANDFCWITFVGIYPPAFLESIVIGLCILWHPNERIYPRWLGIINIVLAIIFLAGVTIPFVTSGPFAWNGLISYWAVAAVFFAWLLLMPWLTIRAIQNSALPAPAAGWASGTQPAGP